MPFSKKPLLYFSSSLPNSPSTHNGTSGNFDKNSASSSKRLTRQRKLRHVSDEEAFGYGSLPDSPDLDRKNQTHWSSHAVPHPLPLPQPPELTSAVDFSHAFLITRNHIPAKSKRCDNVNDGDNEKLRLSIPERRASTSGFSSPPNKSQCPYGHLTVNLDVIGSPRAKSAPTSRFPSPVVSPERSNVTRDCSSQITAKRFLFPLQHKEWPECGNQMNAHPLPLPPGPSHCEKSVSMGKGQWRKGKLIGRGTFGSVYVGTHRETGASCAIKEVDIVPDDPKSAECIKQLEQEIRVLQNLKHPNIVQYYGSEIVDDHFYIYLEYVHPGSISKYVHEHCGDMTESIVRNFTRHILSGLAYLHSTKTIHRDIKGANLLVNSSGTVKLADFGMAKHLTGLSCELSLKGSPHWMAPEVIQAVLRKDASPDVALAVDIWSLGCTIIEMYTGKPPWGDNHGPAAMFQVLHKIPPIPETMSADGKDFLLCCLRRDTAKRPSALTLLDHPFVQNSSDPSISSCTHALSSINLMEKPLKSGECTTDKTNLTSSSGKRVTNGKLPNYSEIGQQNQDKIFNGASACYHSPRSTFDDLLHFSPTQAAHRSHNFISSPTVAGNMQLNSINNHPLSFARSHDREIPHM